jgi:hypothetical protein
VALAIAVPTLVLLAATVCAVVSGVRSLAGRSGGDLERRVANPGSQVAALRPERRERRAASSTGLFRWADPTRLHGVGHIER